MRKLRSRVVRLRPVLALTALLGLILILWPARVVRSDNFVLYMPNAHHVLPITAIHTKKYLPLLQVLNLVGKVNGLAEKKNSLKVWFGSNELEFHQKDPKVRIAKNVVELKDPVLVENGQWMVPVDFLISTLTQITHQQVGFQMGSNRIFIGDVRPNSFTVRLDRLSNGARVAVQFADKVNVRTVASNGKWVMFLGERPVEPIEQAFHFQDSYVSELRFDDQDGVPKLVLTPAAGGLNFYPVLAEGGKVLLADVIKPPAIVAEQTRPTEPLSQAPTPVPVLPPAPAAGETPAAPPGPPLPAVVLDAGHGGSDVGSRSRDGVMEKDLVAQLVARARTSLFSTKKFRIVLTRVGDVNQTFDQREVAANLARPAFFLTFHAGNLGAGSRRVAVFAYEPSSRSEGAANPEPRALFIPWMNAQVSHLERSWQVAQALQQNFAKISGITTDKSWRAPVRTLRSVDAPAVAVEIGSLSPEIEAGPLTSPEFQQQIAGVIAQTLENISRSEP